MPTLDQDEEDDSSSSDGYYTSSCSDQEDQGENSPQEQTVPLTVTISKGDGSSLEFSCTAYPDRVEIDDISMKQQTPGVVAAVLEDDEDDQVYKFR
jgi:complement component 1 Q subcomponent-binding protein